MPESYWHSPHLRAINRRVSAVWAACTLAAAVSVTAAPALARSAAGEGRHPMTWVLTWLVPLALVLIACRYTEAATDTGAGRTSA